jgi:succinate dehydrogenase / fumarate reductase flavoprotein subunit
MWENCGVVRSGEKLLEGLEKINKLKESLKNLDVRPDSEGYEDLMLAFDLEGSIMSAETTILGAIERKESRGAHQRSDHQETKPDFDANFTITLNKDSILKISKESLKNA